MVRKYSILGISLSDCPVKEAVSQIEGYLRGGALRTAAGLTAHMLELAAADEDGRELMEKTDLTVCMEADILEAAGISCESRIKEIEENLFWTEFLEELARRQSGIYLLADTSGRAEDLLEMLVLSQDNLNIMECRGYEEFDFQPERLINAVNEAAPDVVLSRLKWPADLRLMHEGQRLLNAKLWMALPDRDITGRPRTGVLTEIRRKIFRKKVNEYKEEKADQ